MKVIIIASSKFSSGGTESLHQLADGINNSGGKAYLFFYDNPQKKIEEKFEKYRVTSIDYIEDEIENIVVIPETLTFLMEKNQKSTDRDMVAVIGLLYKDQSVARLHISL